jgi:hypothetical protein
MREALSNQAELTTDARTSSVFLCPLADISSFLYTISVVIVLN